jgi:hypothetical protein
VKCHENLVLNSGHPWRKRREEGTEVRDRERERERERQKACIPFIY